jgi:hypothetical protein
VIFGGTTVPPFKERIPFYPELFFFQAKNFHLRGRLAPKPVD